MRSRGYLLATAGGVAAAAASGGVQAADLPMKSPPPAPYVAAPSWTGFYVGVHAGGVWQSTEATYGDPSSDCTGCGEIGGGSKGGFIGGGQIGYNWQFAPTWVLGVEATISGLTGTATAPPQFNLTKGNGVEGRINWMSTLRGRVGWLMSPDTMIYGTGGVAWGHVENSANPNGLQAGCCGPNKSVSKTKTGWVAGGGMEHMLGGAWSHWTVALEGLFVDLGHSSATTGTKTSNFKNSAAIVQVKLNYKF